MDKVKAVEATDTAETIKNTSLFYKQQIEKSCHQMMATLFYKY